MPTVAIGDIHGELDALNDILARLKPELSSGDMVVFLGDYIDRGPRSRECIDRILDFSATTPADVVGLLGNHEEWLLRTIRDPTRHSWLIGMEAFATIESYSPEAAAALRAAAEQAGERLYLNPGPLPYEQFFDAMPPAHRAFLDGLRPTSRPATWSASTEASTHAAGRRISNRRSLWFGALETSRPSTKDRPGSCTAIGTTPRGTTQGVVCWP